MLKYQGPPFPWDNAHIYVSVGLGLGSKADEVLSLQPEKESPSGLLRCPTPHVVCDSQVPGSHRPFSPVNGAMQGQGCFQRSLQNGPSGRAAGDILGAKWIRIEAVILLGTVYQGVKIDQVEPTRTDCVVRCRGANARGVPECSSTQGLMWPYNKGCGPVERLLAAVGCDPDRRLA